MSNKQTDCIIIKIADSPVTNILELITGIARQIRRIEGQSTKLANLTPSQFMILRTLWKKDEQPFKDLADSCCCSRPTITGIIDSLEKKTLVQRIANPKDRRSLLVKLTSKGKQQQKDAPSMDDIFASCCGGLSKKELDTLNTLLLKLNSSLR